MARFQIKDEKGNEGWTTFEGFEALKVGDKVSLYLPHRSRFLRFLSRRKIIAPYRLRLMTITERV